MMTIHPSKAEKLHQLRDFARRQRRLPGHTHIAGWAVDEIERLLAREKELDTLLYAVQRIFPGETRFQTALRYIKQVETPPIIQITSAHNTGV